MRGVLRVGGSEVLRRNNMLVYFGLVACTACVPKAVTPDSAEPSETGDLWSGWSIDPDTLPAGSAPCRAPLVAELEYVIDGDTAWLDTGEGTVKVRSGTSFDNIVSEEARWG